VSARWMVSSKTGEKEAII